MYYQAVPSLYRVAIDRGHGGTDRGAVGNGIVEADYVTEIAARYLERIHTAHPDWGALILSGSEVDPYKSARDKRAREFGADLVQSIHVDSLGNPARRGATVFVWGGNRRILPVAEAIRSGLPTDLWSTRRAPREVVRLSPAESVYPDAAGVVGGFTPPTVLLECGFLSNPTNALYLRTDAAKDRIVDALLAGAEVGESIYRRAA